MRRNYRPIQRILITRNGGAGNVHAIDSARCASLPAMARKKRSVSDRTSDRIEPGIARVQRGGTERFRVQLSGTKVGGRRLSRDCLTYEEARAVKRAWLESGGHPLPAITSAPESTVGYALDRYIADLRARRADTARATTVRSALRRHLPALLDGPVGRVTEADLWAYRHAREDAGIKPNTIIRDLRVLRAMLKKARPDLTVPAAVFPPENLTRVRVLQPHDEARVFPLLREPFRTMARLAALTLMRQGDLRTLRVDMVYLEQQLILLPKTKTVPRPVMLSDEATDLLRRQLATLPADAVYVFPSRRGVPFTPWWISAQWRRAARAAGLRGFTFHDLKHHGATVLVNNDASDAQLMQAGGWTRPDQIRRYGAAVSGRMRALLNGISRGLQHDHQRFPEA